jgi:hypothetical protein
LSVNFAVEHCGRRGCQATAVAKDAQGAIITGSRRNGRLALLASVSSSGVVTGLQAGTVQ